MHIISYNILNHTKPNLKILLRNYKLANQIIKNELERQNIVETTIIKVLQGEEENIIFLQEVNEKLLRKLKKKFFLFHTKELDYNNKKEFRVIILPNSFKEYKITSHEILLSTDKSKKNGLMLIIDNLILINLHLYWKLNNEEIKNFADKIYKEINKKNINPKIIIGGDFNKSINKVKKYFIGNFGIKLVNHYKNYKNKFTSYTTDITETKDRDIIDHILTTTNIKTGNTEIVENDLFIDLELYTKILTSKYSESKYISDHKMIKLKVLL
jgi:endonuclease/exonuclease/phosphatase family metal-dependent hydrolase